MTLIDDLLSFQSRLLTSIHGIPEHQLRRAERDGSWSIVNVISHLSDVEVLTTVRVSMTLADDLPQLPSLSQNAWVEKVHRDEPVADILENLWHARRRNIALLRRASVEELERRARHPDFGIMTVLQIFERIAAHQQKHLAQIERIKKTFGLEASLTPNLAGVTAVAAEEAPVRSPGPGIRIRDLWQRGVSRAQQVEFDAGASWPGLDYHVPGPEQVFVVSGDFSDGANQYRAGTFVHHPAGSSHSPYSDKGCVLFVLYPEG